MSSCTFLGLQRAGPPAAVLEPTQVPRPDRRRLELAERKRQKRLAGSRNLGRCKHRGHVGARPCDPGRRPEGREPRRQEGGCSQPPVLRSSPRCARGARPFDHECPVGEPDMSNTNPAPQTANDFRLPNDRDQLRQVAGVQVIRPGLLSPTEFHHQYWTPWPGPAKQRRCRTATAPSQSPLDCAAVLRVAVGSEPVRVHVVQRRHPHHDPLR
jgi:hypothetical protein